MCSDSLGPRLQGTVLGEAAAVAVAHTGLGHLFICQTLIITLKILKTLSGIS